MEVQRTMIDVGKQINKETKIKIVQFKAKKYQG